jgi:hypothetical protein
MLSASTLQFLFQLAKGISRQFGPNCEVVVHDLDSTTPTAPSSPLKRPCHGTEGGGRPLSCGAGGPAQRQGEPDRPSELPDPHQDGKILKSSTIYVRDDDGEAIGIFAINYDITSCWPWRRI